MSYLIDPSLIAPLFSGTRPQPLPPFGHPLHLLERVIKIRLKAFVIVHHQLGINLLYSLNNHSHHNQHAGPANSQRLGIGNNLHQKRQYRDQAQKYSPRERNPIQNPVEEIRSLFARPQSRHKSALLLQVI